LELKQNLIVAKEGAPRSPESRTVFDEAPPSPKSPGSPYGKRHLGEQTLGEAPSLRLDPDAPTNETQGGPAGDELLLLQAKRLGKGEVEVEDGPTLGPGSERASRALDEARPGGVGFPDRFEERHATVVGGEEKSLAVDLTAVAVAQNAALVVDLPGKGGSLAAGVAGEAVEVAA